MVLRNSWRVAPLLLTLLLSACGASRLVHPGSWHRKPPPPPPAAISVLDVRAPNGAAAPTLAQRWDRNTLLIDLSPLAGEGSLEIAPHAGKVWPVRIALVVRAGSVGELEVLGAERLQFTVPASGGDVSYALAPEAYPPEQKSLRFLWRAAAPAP